MCALELVYPDVGPVADQYLLGADLLVAPILEAGCTSRRVILPEGHWSDLFAPSRTFTGPTVISVEVGPDDIPVFVRGGATLALLPDDVVSLSPYAPDLPDRRSVLAFPGEARQRWSGCLGPGVRCQSQWSDDSWSLELSAPRPMAFAVTALLPGVPVDVHSDGPWSFSAGRLSCSVSGGSAAVRARWIGAATR
jgi:hypothetical protein